MTDEPRVEVIIRKKPTFSVTPEVPAFRAPRVPRVSGAGIGKAIKYLIVIILVLAIGFGAYKFYPIATSFVLMGFGESFDYTITAKAIETFIDEGTADISFLEKSGSKTINIGGDTIIKIFLFDGENLNEKTSFSASKGSIIYLNYEHFETGGDLVISKNGGMVFNDLSTSLKGVQLQYEAVIEKTFERTATQEGTAKVAKNGNPRKITEVEVEPEAQTEEGELGEITYDVTTTLENVEAWVEEGFLYVKYVEPESEEEAEE